MQNSQYLHADHLRKFHGLSNGKNSYTFLERVDNNITIISENEENGNLNVFHVEKEYARFMYKKLLTAGYKKSKVKYETVAYDEQTGEITPQKYYFQIS